MAHLIAKPLLDVQRTHADALLTEHLGISLTSQWEECIGALTAKGWKYAGPIKGSDRMYVRNGMAVVLEDNGISGWIVPHGQAFATDPSNALLSSLMPSIPAIRAETVLANCLSLRIEGEARDVAYKLAAAGSFQWAPNGLNVIPTSVSGRNWLLSAPALDAYITVSQIGSKATARITAALNLTHLNY